MATDGMNESSQINSNDVSPGPFAERSEAAHLGGLNDVFPNHPKTGPWYSLAGKAMAPWELEVMNSTAEGDTRHQAATMSPSWDSTTVVSTGMTKGGSGADYNSDLPNH